MTSTTTTRLSENEIRPQELMSEQQRRFANDIDRLHEHLGRFVKVACPACGGKDSHFEWEKYKLSYVSCANCRTIYINPRPPPDVLEHYYRNSENYAYWNDVIFPASEDVRREKLFKPRAERLIDICRRHGGEGGTLLEVGAGFGTFGHCPGRCGLQPAPSGQSGQQIGKDFDRVIADVPQGRLSRPSAERLPCPALLPGPFEGAVDEFRLGEAREVSVDPVLDEFRDARRGRRHHSPAAQGRLEHDDGHSLLARGMKEQMVTGPDLPRRGKTSEAHLEPLEPAVILDPLPVATLAEKSQRHRPLPPLR